MPYRKKWKFWSKGVIRGLRNHFGEFWDPLHISATAEAWNLKFGTQNYSVVPCRKTWKVGSNGVTRGLCNHFGEFWDLLHISATAEATNSKFGMQNDREVPYRKKWKFRSKRVARGHVTIFGNFGTPSISRQWLKLDMGSVTPDSLGIHQESVLPYTRLAVCRVSRVGLGLASQASRVYIPRMAIHTATGEASRVYSISYTSSSPGSQLCQ